MAEKTRSQIFEEALASFTKATKSSMKAAEICARCALEEFADHGNLKMAQTFYDAMPANYTRKSAFRRWLCEVAPVMVENGKYVKDPKRAATMTVDVEKATKVPFWDAKPAEAEPFNYSADYIVEQAQRLITRLENHARYKPTDHKAEVRLNQFKQAVNNLIALPLPENNEEPTEEETGTEEGAEKAA